MQVGAVVTYRSDAWGQRPTGSLAHTWGKRDRRDDDISSELQNHLQRWGFHFEPKSAAAELCTPYHSPVKSRALSWLPPAATLPALSIPRSLQPYPRRFQGSHTPVQPSTPTQATTKHNHQAHPSHATRNTVCSPRTSFPNTTFLHRCREPSPQSHSIWDAPRANRRVRLAYCSPRKEPVCARLTSIRLLTAMHGIARRSTSRTRLADSACPSLPVFGWGGCQV